MLVAERGDEPYASHFNQTKGAFPALDVRARKFNQGSGRLYLLQRRPAQALRAASRWRPRLAATRRTHWHTELALFQVIDEFPQEIKRPL